MIIRLLAVMLVLFAGTAFGQHRGSYWSLGGFGNVLFPGTGHAPPTPPGGINGPHFFTNGFKAQGHWGDAAAVQSTPEAIVVDRPGDDSEEQNAAQTVPAGEISPALPQVIDQELILGKSDLGANGDYQSGRQAHPDKPGACENSTSEAAWRPHKPCNGEPTVYILALKNGSTVQALGYWIQGSILYYVSSKYALNQISLVLVDEQRSQELNAEQGLDFTRGLSK